MEKNVIYLCGASRGRYGSPVKVTSPDGITQWVSEETGRRIRAPKRIACESPTHHHPKGRKWWPTAEAYVQRWEMTEDETRAAIEAFDIFSLEMPSRLLCPPCAQTVQEQSDANLE